jgi:hypothetical protein
MANGLRPFALPRPMPQGVSYVQISVVYIRNIIPIRAPVGLSHVQSKQLPGRAWTPHPPARPGLVAKSYRFGCSVMGCNSVSAYTDV